MNIDIREYGAVGDGKTMNTQAIQRAVDRCGRDGGGTVTVSGGRYKTGTVVLRSGVNLHLDYDGVLLGSDRCEDYPETLPLKHVTREMLPRARAGCLILADECDGISITGKGKIDCSGSAFVEPDEATEGKVNPWPYKRIDAPTPPRVLFLTGCTNILLEDFTMINSPAGWACWIHDCDFVNADRLKILVNVDFPNNDGIHINSSRNVSVSNCFLECGDDALIVRANNSSLQENKVCEGVTVTNCTLRSHSAGIRVGWINDGTIRNCTFTNLVMLDCSVGISIALPGHDRPERLADEGREDTEIEYLSFSNITMDRGVGCPIALEISDKPSTRCSYMRNLYFHNMHCRCFQLPIMYGTEKCHLSEIGFSDCTFEQLPMKPGADVNHGPLPALLGYDGESRQMYIKCVDNLSFHNTRFYAMQ